MIVAVMARTRRRVMVRCPIVKGVDLPHLRYFVAVAEERSFTRAAARLHMAGSPLSQRIKDLERELGTPLFIRARTTGSISPMPAKRCYRGPATSSTGWTRCRRSWPMRSGTPCGPR